MFIVNQFLNFILGNEKSARHRSFFRLSFSQLDSLLHSPNQPKLKVQVFLPGWVASERARGMIGRKKASALLHHFSDLRFRYFYLNSFSQSRSFGDSVSFDWVVSISSSFPLVCLALNLRVSAEFALNALPSLLFCPFDRFTLYG